jgi:ABC-type antimicrobial peptide transport system permease subunit
MAAAGAFAAADTRGESAKLRVDYPVSSGGGLPAGAVMLVWVVTGLAGLYPARVASRMNPIEVIQEE